jgi:hypothetical protein
MTRMVELTRLTVTGVSLPEDPAAEAAMQALAAALQSQLAAEIRA